MLIREAKAVIGSLGAPSKMPGTSYGISAKACKTGAKLAQIEGSTCHGCYALKGNYIYRDVKKSHAKRLEGIMHPMWKDAMVRMLKNKHSKGTLPPFHRWHDSGDIQSEEHLAKICDVARETPELMHWLPTREMNMLAKAVAAGLDVPANLTIRVSATMIDGNATKAWTTTSTVHKDKAAQGHQCPAPAQGNKCGECRACWFRDVANVSYHVH